MAHTKSAGAGKYGRDSNPKYLGIKKHDGERTKAGTILVRQRGTYFIAGEGVRKGGDDTLYALREGFVKFLTKRRIHFDGSRKYRKMISVITPKR